MKDRHFKRTKPGIIMSDWHNQEYDPRQKVKRPDG